MLLGIITFIAFYTLANSSKYYSSFMERDIFARKSLRCGFGLKVAHALLSSLVLMGSNGDFLFVVLLPDIYAGFAAISFVKLFTRENDFFFSYLTTIVEGAILSLGILTISLLICVGLHVWHNKQKKDNLSV